MTEREKDGLSCSGRAEARWSVQSLRRRGHVAKRCRGFAVR
jgi:hypothetical protein